MERILISGPSITQKEIDYVTDAVTNAWYGNANMYHERFERAFADYLGVRFAVSLPSCTSAIHLALLALGIGEDDEVIVPDSTWIASAAPITYVRATTVFADVDARTWCLSPESFEHYITPNTKAVIPVHLYGNVADMDSIRAIAAKHQIAVIEDAAEALGAESKGQKLGSLSDASVFSFHGSKMVTTGEGGMLATDREDIYQRVLILRDHGRKPGDKMFWNQEIGHKYKMSSMQAALGLAQLERIEELLAYKRQIFAWYEQEFADLDGITLNYQSPGSSNAYWMITPIVDASFGIKKEQLIALMSARNIDCRPFFYPLSSLPAYADTEQAQYAQRHNTTSRHLSDYGVNLPSGLNLTQPTVKYICDSFKGILLNKYNS
jgi:perosamine synthetase